MGIDTKMFIATNTNNFLEIMPKVICKLSEWQREKLDKEAEKEQKNRMSFLIENKDNWSNGINNVYTYEFNSFHINFRVNGEKRNLFVTHVCSNDYSDVFEGEKIIFSLGCWGMSEEIMMVVADAIKEFGDIYYTNNDCETNFRLLEFV